MLDACDAGSRCDHFMRADAKCSRLGPRLRSDHGGEGRINNWPVAWAAVTSKCIALGGENRQHRLGENAPAEEMSRAHLRIADNDDHERLVEAEAG
jgi:hypothetical protein